MRIDKVRIRLNGCQRLFKYLTPILNADSTEPCLTTLSIDVERRDFLPPNYRSLLKLGSGIYIDNLSDCNLVYWKTNEWSLMLHTIEDNYFVRFYFKKKLHKKLQYLFSPIVSPNYNIEATIYRYAIVLPLEVILNRLYGARLFHASATVDGFGLVTLFYGLNGSGKSSVSKNLDHDSKLISDNFVFIKSMNEGVYVSPLPDYLKLNTKRRNGAIHAFGKTLQPVLEYQNSWLKVKETVLIALSSENNKLSSFPPNTITKLDSILAEYGHSTPLSFMFTNDLPELMLNYFKISKYNDDI